MLVVIGLWLLYSMLGVSAVVGLGTIPVLALLSANLSKAMYRKYSHLSMVNVLIVGCDKAWARATDDRIGAIKEFLLGIKVVKVGNNPRVALLKL
jgi:hypothetical protein